MKKKVFDVGLYRDGCRQLKVIGAISALFLVLESVLVPLYRMLHIADQYGSRSIADIDITSLDLMTMHPMALFVLIFTVPAMMLTLFSFLNHRNASDFYHSIPQTRTCLCVSSLASVLTWAMALLWGSTFISWALHMVLRTGTEPLESWILKECFSMSILCLLVAAAILLCMSVTGNTFSNVLVTGVLLFGPRLVMLFMKLTVGSSLNIISEDRYLGFLGNEWNMLTGLIYGFFTDYLTEGSFLSILVSPSAILYTLVLALIYLGLGIHFFRVRPSEAAGQASVSSRLQLVFRLAPAFIFSLIPDLVVFEDITNGSSMSGEEWFGIFVLYLISVILYFLYELISTRRIRNLKRAIPGVLTLAMLDIAIIVGMLGMRSSILSFCPTADEISGVSLSARSIDLYMGDTGLESYDTYDGYLSSRAAQISLTDDTVKEIVADRLAAAVSADRNNIGSTDDSCQVTIGITVNGKTTYRVIPFNTADAERFIEALKNEPELQDIYMNLPDPDDGNLHLSISDSSDMRFTPEQTKEVYAALLEDVQEMGFAEW